MNVKQSMLALVQGLCEGTGKGTIAWTETADENSFRAVLNEGIVRVEKYLDPRATVGSGAMPIATGLPFILPRSYKTVDDQIFTLVVLNEKNRELGRYVPDDEMQALTLRNLWEAASWSARNVEQKLGAILREITSRQVAK